jgi:hypothetical protein
MLRNAVRFACIALIIAAALLWPHIGRAVEPARADMVWAACPVQDREAARDKVVRQFPRAVGNAAGRTMPAGMTNLTCGDERYGYYHIVGNHGEEWKYRGAQSSENWRDVADYAIQEALANPQVVTYRADNDTFCYSREIFLWNKVRGIRVDVFQPNVVVSAQHQHIITVIPTNKPCR